MTANPYSSYTASQLDNKSPAEQVAALFAKAAEHMKEAKSSIEKNDIYNRYESSQKATTILEGLMASLNRDTAEREQIARNLETYYKTMINLISRVNIYNDIRTCDSLIAGFEDMAKFWKEAGVHLEQQQAEFRIPDQANLKA